MPSSVSIAALDVGFSSVPFNTALDVSCLSIAGFRSRTVLHKLARSIAALCAFFISMKQRPIALPMQATRMYAKAYVYVPVVAIDVVRMSGPSHDEPRLVSSYSAKKAACEASGGAHRDREPSDATVRLSLRVYAPVAERQRSLRRDRKANGSDHGRPS